MSTFQPFALLLLGMIVGSSLSFESGAVVTGHFISASREAILLDASLSNPYSSEIFQEHYFPTKNYTRYSGNGEVSMYGSAVAVSGKHAAVGSFGSDLFSGQVEVFAVSHSPMCSWSAPAVVKSPVAGSINFGVSVSLDDQTLVVGANAFDFYAGKVFVYTLVGENFWRLTQSITSPLGQISGFGTLVQVRGSHLLVSSTQNIVVFYERDVFSGQFRASIQFNVPATPTSIALSEEYAVVGMETYGDSSSGLVHIYRFDSVFGKWAQVAVIPSVTGTRSLFGHAVAVAGSTVVVTAPGLLVDPYLGPLTAGGAVGWVYIYDLGQNSTYTLSQAIESPCGPDSNFGGSVAMDGDIIVGASGYPAGSSSGASFVYRRNSAWNDLANWALDHSMPSTTGTNSQFGTSVAISGMYAVVGANTDDDLRGSSYLICRPRFEGGSRPLSLSPTYLPTMKPTDATNAQNLDKTSNKKKNAFPLGLIIAVALGGTLITFLATLVFYCMCVRPLPPIMEKKKKSSEDDVDIRDRLSKLAAADGASTAYGADDTDVSSSVYSKDFLASFDDGDLNGLLSMSQDEDKKDGKEGKKGKNSKGKGKNTQLSAEEFRAKNPYKVHSYAGYVEDVSFDALEQVKAQQAEEQEEADRLQRDTLASQAAYALVNGMAGCGVGAEESAANAYVQVVDDLRADQLSAHSVVTSRIIQHAQRRPTELSRGFNKPREVMVGSNDAWNTLRESNEIAVVNTQLATPLNASARKAHSSSPNSVGHSLSSDSTDARAEEENSNTRSLVPGPWASKSLRYFHSSNGGSANNSSNAAAVPTGHKPFTPKSVPTFPPVNFNSKEGVAMRHTSAIAAEGEEQRMGDRDCGVAPEHAVGSLPSTPQFAAVSAVASTAVVSQPPQQQAAQSITQDTAESRARASYQAFKAKVAESQNNKSEGK